MKSTRGKGIARYVVDGYLEMDYMTRHVIGLPQIRVSDDGRIKFQELRSVRVFLIALRLLFIDNPTEEDASKRRFFMGYIIDAFFGDVSKAPTSLRGRTYWLANKIREIETIIGRITRNTGLTPGDRENALAFFTNFKNAITIYQREMKSMLQAIAEQSHK